MANFAIVCGVLGGSGEIRTHGGYNPSLVFKTSALNRSATLPDEPRNCSRPLACVNKRMNSLKNFSVNDFSEKLATLQVRLHDFSAPWRRCSSLQNEVCSVVSPSQKADKPHTPTCSTAVSRLRQHYTQLGAIWHGQGVNQPKTTVASHSRSAARGALA